MKKRIGLIFVASFLLSGLAGCSMTGENYYTIDVYSDYIGMEEDLAAHGRYTVDIKNASAMAAVGLKKVGYCYAVKGKDAKIGGIQLVDQNFNGRSSTRTPDKGHKYTFNGFVGYYGANQKIDLNSIQSDCYVFATFVNELEDYQVTVRNAYEASLYTDRLVYGESAASLTAAGNGELEEVLRSSPVHDALADPNDYSTWRDAHYLEYTFDKWRFSVEGEKKEPGWTYNSSKNRSRIDFTKDEAVAYAFEEQTRIDPVYITTTKSYDVAISYQIRTYDEINQKYVYTAPVKVASQTVEYGQGVDIAAIGLTGYTCVNEGKNGVPSRYGDDMDLKPTEIQAKLPSTLYELYEGGYRGMAVDYKNIAFGCAITLIFVEDAPVFDLTFHPDCVLPTATMVIHASEGDTFTPPTVTNIPAGKIFADWGVLNELDVLVPADVYNLKANADLYPILVDETIVTGGLTFKYLSDRKGYALTEVGETLTEILPAQFDLSAFPEHYPLNGISSFAGPSGVGSELLTRIELPADNEISWIAHGAFTNTRLNHIEQIDLMNSKVLSLSSYAFHNLARVTEIDLPASLYEVGAELFQNDVSLNIVRIDLTKDEVAERAFNVRWYGELDESKIIYNS